MQPEVIYAHAHFNFFFTNSLKVPLNIGLQAKC